MDSMESYTMNFFLAFFLLAIPLFFHGVHASHEVFQELQSIDKAMPVNPLYRTKYHFQPLAHWINDPNGPMYYKGLYHLFYQYNPYGSVWGNIVWAHSVSTDLINWLPMEPAIFPSKEFDINGCWSGSATILPDGKPVILYTGINTKNQQVQNLATPANDMDPFLRDWVKSPMNPVMFPTESNQINASSFRDPTTAWKGKDGLWRVLIGSKRDSTGMAILYKSSDFKKWVQAKSPIHFSNNTGMWECPDFYPVPLEGTLGLDTSEDGSSLKHVLKVSLDDKKYEYYTVGTYYQDKDQYVPDTTSPDNSMGLRYDYGKFYASKTFFDPQKNRRILWGWMNESDSVFDDQQKGWAGVQAVPRKVWLDSSKKQLVQWPIEEIESLRRSKVSMDNTKLQSGAVVEIKGVTGSQADVEVTFELKSGLDVAEEFDQDVTNQLNAQLLCSQKDASNKGSIGPFGLFVLASKDLHEQTAVFFRVFKGQGNKPVVVMCSDQSKSSMGTELDKTTYGAFVDADLKDGKLSLRTLVDHSIVESFGAGGKTCITARVYPRIALGKDAHLFAFNYGSTAVSISNLSAWSVLEASIN